MKFLQEEFQKLKCLVIGDMALDINTVGKYGGRMSREIEGLPVFTYPWKEVTYNPGGAANLAKNIRTLGVETYVCGTWGKRLSSDQLLKLSTPWRYIKQRELILKDIDWNRMLLEDFFHEAGINPCMIQGQRTPVFGKYFFPVGHHIMRIDSASAPISERSENLMITMIHTIAEKCDYIVVADYDEEGLGVCTTRILQTIAKLEKPTFGASRERILSFRNFDHLIISQGDLNKAIGRVLFAEKLLEDLGIEDQKIALLFYDTKAKRIVKTLEEEGVLFFYKDHRGKIGTLSVRSKPVTGLINPCGAGDTFFAIYSTAVAAKIAEDDAIKLGIAGARATLTNIFQTGYPSYEEIEQQYIELYTEKDLEELKSFFSIQGKADAAT